MTKEVMKHYEAALLEAFPRGATGDVFYHWNKARQAIEQAEKQEQGEPVAWFRKENGENIYYATKAWDDCLPLYTTPQTKEWAGLTDEDIEDCYIEELYLFAVALEARLKEKNS